MHRSLRGDRTAASTALQYHGELGASIFFPNIVSSGYEHHTPTLDSGDYAHCTEFTAFFERLESC